MPSFQKPSNLQRYRLLVTKVYQRLNNPHFLASASLFVSTISCLLLFWLLMNRSSTQSIDLKQANLAFKEANSLLEKRMLNEQNPTGTGNAAVSVDATKRKEIYNQDMSKFKQMFPYLDKNLVAASDYLHQQPRMVDYVDKQVYTPYATILKQINPKGYEEGLSSNWSKYTAAFPTREFGSRASSPTGVISIVVNDLIMAKKYALSLIQQKAGYPTQPNTLPQEGYDKIMKTILNNNGITV